MDGAVMNLVDQMFRTASESQSFESQMERPPFVGHPPASNAGFLAASIVFGIWRRETQSTSRPVSGCQMEMALNTTERRLVENWC
jgi:arginyl-tRNA--protein-N-Asp/Glu arginylyltransferase